MAAQLKSDEVQDAYSQKNVYIVQGAPQAHMHSSKIPGI
jgi:hypothetical protein